MDDKVSAFIEQQFPAIYREEGPLFVEFVKQYFVWLETDPSSPVYQSRKHLRDHDIDSTVDDFVIYFKEKYLKNIQFNTATNTKQIVKKSIDLYRSKGTENGIKLFFDLVFSSPVDIYYPTNDIFRLSSAEYAIPRYLEVSLKDINRVLVGRSITGVQSGATAFVEKLVRRRVNSEYREILYLSAISGAFVTGEIIKLTTPGSIDIGEFPVMLGSLTTLEITDGGNNFAKGDIVSLSSRTGQQGKAVVVDTESVSNQVEFELIDGGWGYTSNSDVRVSENILMLSNVEIVSISNNTLDNKITNIVQPLANVQWYANTDDFVVGDIVYNYYSNGSVIGTSKIISAEYGNSNTTNFFLLNTISGNTDIDTLYYYKAGNTASFEVQPAGHEDVTATGTRVGMSSNIYFYCTGNSAAYSKGDQVYQVTSNGDIFVTSTITGITGISPNFFSLRVNEVSGLPLTNKQLLKTGSNTVANVSYLSLEIGVLDVDNSFVYVGDNMIKDTNSDSLFRAKIVNIPFGSGASVEYDPDLINTEEITLNSNFLFDHIDDLNSSNWINATSYGVSLNNANLTYLTLDDALDFVTTDIGTIVKLVNQNPGVEYTYPPFIEIFDPLVGPLLKQDFVLNLSSPTGVFKIGEKITQTINSAQGIVKAANSTAVHVKRLTYADRWVTGSSNSSYLIVGEDTGFNGYVSSIEYDIEGVAGRNAEILTRVSASESSIASLKVTDSGFGFRDGDEVSFISSDLVRAGSAIGYVQTTGYGTGYYRTKSGFLSDNKYLYDGEYYQDFSYEIKSPITASKYIDMLKNILHVSGTKVFSSILSISNIDSASRVVSGSFDNIITTDEDVLTMDDIDLTLGGFRLTLGIPNGTLTLDDDILTFDGYRLTLG